MLSRRIYNVMVMMRRKFSSSDFSQDENSSLKYWESEYNAKRNDSEEDKDPYYAMYEKNAAAADAAATLSHVDSNGKAKMVDVSGKSETTRAAVAGARVRLGRTAFDLVRTNAVAKGDVLTVSQLAGIMGAKRTSDLIPLCHPLPLSSVDVRLRLEDADASISIECEAKCVGRTGVEMEAMVGASVAALTVYDMCKAVDKGIVIEEVRLLKKTGGKSGEYVAP